MLASLPERWDGKALSLGFVANLNSQELTFPDEDFPIGAVIQNEAVSGLQGTLGKRVLSCHQGDGHASTGIGHLQQRSFVIEYLTLLIQITF